MTDRIPIIFVHDGDQKYFKAAVEQAQRFSSNVVVLPMSNDADMWREFERFYVHLSTNNELIEKFCFKRYFLMYKYMVDHSVETAVLIDSDVLIFEDLGLMARDLVSGGFSVGLCMSRVQDGMRMSYSAHTSVWTIGALREFCEYCLHIYKEEMERLTEKWTYHLQNKQNGGVCDMTLLYLWANKRPGVLNLSMVRDGKVVDENINFSENYEPDEYRMRYGLKKLRFRNGKPVGQRRDGSKVSFRTLHFQGKAKAHMKYVHTRGRISELLCLKRYLRQRFPAVFKLFERSA